MEVGRRGDVATHLGDELLDRVDFLHKIRDEQRFDAVEELVAQMRRDIAETADLQDPAFAEVGLAAPAAL